MVYPLVRRLWSAGLLDETHWVSLSPSGGGPIRSNGVVIHSISLDKKRMGGYGVAKEAIWGHAHGMRSAASADGFLWSDDFSEYAYYNRATAELMRNLDKKCDFDLFYVHDFQQLAIGEMLSTLKPKVFRWHIPFDRTTVPEEWKLAVQGYLNSYDVVIVSTERYRRALRVFGYQGEIRRMYPYVDPNDYSYPEGSDLERVCHRFALYPGDEVALVVGRMDPIKGQDIAIRATADLVKRNPRLKLVLAGNGSFSGSDSGLGLSKSALWRAYLEKLVRDLDVSDRVVFTGYVTQRELDALFERCRFSMLPSVREGFGLVVVESWLHRKPALVSERAGISELARGVSSRLLFDPEDPKTLAEKMDRLLEADEESLRRIGEKGNEAAKHCLLDEAVEAETRLIEETVGT